MTQEEKPSAVWTIIVICFGIIGGIIMYFAFKDTNIRIANNALINGFCVSLGAAIIGIGFYFMLLLSLGELIV